MNITCQCGAVSFRSPTPAPIKVYFCHCTECRKQSTTAFGTSATFPAEGIFPLSPELESKLSVWIRPAERADSGRAMKCYFCKVCGVRVMHRIVEKDGSERGIVSVKGGCVDGVDWSSAAHIFVENAVISVPEDVEQHPRSPF